MMCLIDLLRRAIAELSRATSAGPTLYVLDEPTTGLHREDVRRLVALVDRFVERGDTVVVIEHHPDVMAAADWLVDLGPEAGDEGGEVIGQGSPETLAKLKGSHTGALLKREFRRAGRGVGRARRGAGHARRASIES